MTDRVGRLTSLSIALTGIPEGQVPDIHSSKSKACSLPPRAPSRVPRVAGGDVRHLDARVRHYHASFYEGFVPRGHHEGLRVRDNCLDGGRQWEGAGYAHVRAHPAVAPIAQTGFLWRPSAIYVKGHIQQQIESCEHGLLRNGLLSPFAGRLYYLPETIPSEHNDQRTKF